MLFTCRNAAFGYDGKIVLEDLDFTVNAGDRLCVLGENGSGKTTLVKGILGLIAPLRGEVAWSGEIRPNETGWLSQETAKKADFPAAVMEIVLSGFAGRMGLRPLYRRREKQAALENLARTGAAALRNRCFRELSGGQKRRVLIARALCASEKLLILDEPASGLDPQGQTELYALLENLNRETGIAVVMVSHDSRAADMATAILHLRNRQLFFGAAADFLQSEAGKVFFR